MTDDFDDMSFLFSSFDSWSNAFDLSTRPSSQPHATECDSTGIFTGQIDETKVKRWGQPETTFSFAAIDSLHNKRRKTDHVHTFVDINHSNGLIKIAESPSLLSPSPSPSVTHNRDTIIVPTYDDMIDPPDKLHVDVYSTDALVDGSGVFVGSHSHTISSADLSEETAKASTSSSMTAGASVIPLSKRKLSTNKNHSSRKLQQKKLFVVNGSSDGALSEERSLESKMVEVLNYTSSLFCALNNGSFKELQTIISTILTPDCVLQTHVTQAASKDSLFVNRIVPHDKIFEYFQVLQEVFPDAIWRVEDTKLRNTNPKTVASICHFRGTRVVTEAVNVLENFNAPDQPPTGPWKRGMVSVSAKGTVCLSLNKELLVQSMDLYYCPENL